MTDGLSRGVIVFNVGTKCLARLIVCLRSLRKHYDGNLTVFLEGPHDKKLVSGIKNSFKCDVIYREKSPSNYRALLRKIEICQESPYDLSMVLDSDTVVTGDFTEMFEAAKGHDLAIPHFAGWLSSGKTISKRINRYKPLKPEYIDAAVNYGPAINCGVFSWPKNTPIFKEWLKIAEWGDNVAHIYIADEVACQLILPRYKVKIVDMKYNVSILHDPGTADPRIHHFHGRKHVRPNVEKCGIWIREFIETLKENTCGIRKMALDECGDKRLSRFIHGNEATMHRELQLQVKDILGLSSRSTCKGFKDSEITIVTACDKKYVEQLRETLPNWIKYKHIDKFEVIVYVNGFRRIRRNKDLDFLRVLPKLRIIPWDMPNAENQREKMLSAFVLGPAKDVRTPYWVKMDADSFACNDEPLLTPEMRDYVLCGHKWGYSWAKHMEILIPWVNNHPHFQSLPKDTFDQAKVEGRKYYQPRLNSYCQFHNTEFVTMAAGLAGDRLPIPSHDTYLWYIAERLKLPYLRHNFKRHRGMNNKSGLDRVKTAVNEIEIGFRKEENDEESQD
jgi:hypothetical protein